MASYSNRKGAPKYVSKTAAEQPRHRPYVANLSSQALTEKEKLARRQSKVGNAMGGGLGMRGGGLGLGNGSTALSSQGNFFSPQLSPDFLELPQSLRERREIYRHFYNSDELVGQALDLHTELPLSKVRLAAPKPRTAPEGFKSPDDYGKYILSRFERMCKKTKLFQKLITMTHHYWMDGIAVIFAEDSTVDVPPEVGHTEYRTKLSALTNTGDPVEKEEVTWVKREDQEEREFEFYRKNYQGWSKIIVLPIDHVKITTFNYTDKSIVELIPSDSDKALIERAKQGDPVAEKLVQEIPEEVRTHIETGQLIPLGTDPDEGSFAYILTGSKSSDSSLGQSILNRCHLPGTLVTVKRDGQVLQLPIEEMDPELDLVLGTGGWREFEHGARHVSQPVSILSVSKLADSVASTADHRYPVLRGDSVIELEAQQILPGDYLRVAQLPLTGNLKRVDMSEVFGSEEPYVARKSSNTATLRTEIVDRSTSTIVVKYSRGETNPARLKHSGDVLNVLRWASTLETPVLKRSAELCEQFDLHPVTLKEIRQQVGAYGYYPTVLRNKTIRFEPFKGAMPETSLLETTKSFPHTLELNGEAGYFLGYWLGDGYISKQPGLDYGVLGVTYGPNEATSVASMDTIIKPFLTKMGVAWSETPSGSGVSLFGYQDALVRWVAQNFGHVCEDKHLPAWVYDTPRPFLEGLVRGFVDSDGDVVRKSDGSVSVRLSNSNATLMSQMLLVCTSLGIPASKTKPTKSRMVRQADGRLSPAKPQHVVHFTHGPAVRALFESGFLAKRQDPEVWKSGRSGALHRTYEGYLYYRVKAVDTSQHTGLVYSLNVHEDHNFFVGSVNTFNCLRTLYYREKLRQAQTMIASRAMTPKRIVWAEDLSDSDVELLREQVDLALVDPDYSIVANYEVHWEEMGSRDRLLDLSSEYEQTERRLLSGLGVTESLMSGESLYSGDRLKLEVINQRYLHLREILQEYVEEALFRPVAQRMGFVEEDEWGQEVVLHPKLSFTRLPLRDSQDTFDALYNLYSKGSISIDLILEMLNIDPNDTRAKIERDMFTVNDAIFNEILRALYNEVGRMLAEKSDVLDRIAGYMQLKLKPQQEEEGGGGRF